MRLPTILFVLLAFPLACLGGAGDGDATQGRDVYLSYCLAFHAFSCNRDGAEAYSPKLAELLGRKAGGLEDFPGYSETLKNAAIIWNDETLNALFTDPSAIVPGMNNGEYHKVATAEEVVDLIAFLKTQDPSVDIFCH